jgi:hypothetical protein
MGNRTRSPYIRQHRKEMIWEGKDFATAFL